MNLQGVRAVVVIAADNAVIGGPHVKAGLVADHRAFDGRAADV